MSDWDLAKSFPSKSHTQRRDRSSVPNAPKPPFAELPTLPQGAAKNADRRLGQLRLSAACQILQNSTRHPYARSPELVLRPTSPGLRHRSCPRLSPLTRDRGEAASPKAGPTQIANSPTNPENGPDRLRPNSVKVEANLPRTRPDETRSSGQLSPPESKTARYGPPEAPANGDPGTDASHRLLETRHAPTPKRGRPRRCHSCEPTKKP